MRAIPEYSLVTRSSDGQMLFLANKLSKMKQGTPARQPYRRSPQRQFPIHRRRRAGTRATSAAGSSRTTGWKLSSPCRSTCSTTPVLPPTSGCSQTASPRTERARCSLIDGTKWFQSPAERTWARRTAKWAMKTSPASATRSCDFKETEQSKIFDNTAFGYWKVTVERPLRIEGADPNRAYKPAEIKKLKDKWRSGARPHRPSSGRSIKKARN